nr:condensation domain-containing protein [Streptacidiphilus sp. P02-A3a]
MELPSVAKDRLSQLPDHVRELVLRQLAGAAGPAPQDRPITPAPRDGALPLSVGQQGLWFLAELNPDSVEYNAPKVLRLTGDLHPRALRAALDDVVARHEALRTTIGEADGHGVQVVHPPAPVPVEYTDLTDLPEPERGRRTRPPPGTRGLHPVRPAPRPPVPGGAAAARRRRTRPGPGPAPHRRRRLVHRAS